MMLGAFSHLTLLERHVGEKRDCANKDRVESASSRPFATAAREKKGAVDPTAISLPCLEWPRLT
jgi:hypothetical protein